MATNRYTPKKFMQKSRRFFTVADSLASDNITSAAISGNGTVYIGTDKGLCVLSGESFNVISGANISVIYTSCAGTVYAGADNSILTLDGESIAASQVLDSAPVSLCEDGDGTLWLATVCILYKLSGGKFSEYDRIDGGFVRAMTAFGSGRVYAANPLGIVSLHGKRPRWAGINFENSNMPQLPLQAIAADKWGHIWFGTKKGAYLYDSNSLWLSPESIDALPNENIKTIFIGADGTRYFGTDIGLIVQSGVTQSFLGSHRWLPCSEVTAVTANSDGSEIWVGTKGGVSRISSSPMSLSEKADYFQQLSEKYHVREGFVTDRTLDKPGEIADGHVCITDNDGLWTAGYLAPQAYRYAVTGEEAALLLARRSFYALKKLVDITGIPGFPARAYRRPGDVGFGNGNSEWHLTQDENGELEWKGETSSDETTGHLYAYSLFYDLCADEKEKEITAKLITDIVDHVLSHGYTLCDCDGLPTTWAHWGPDELNRNDTWFWEKGINSLELLSMLKIACHVSADPKYEAEYKRLITHEHYALNCIQHKVHDNHVNHIDDNLAFLATIPLLRYETDPMLRQYFMLGLRHHWNNQRIERCPLWNLAFGGLTGEHCDVENAVKTLQEMPLDLILYNIKNSERKDLLWDEGQELFDGAPQLKEPLSYEERPIIGYDSNPFVPDDATSECRASDPTIYLHPYWLGRYYSLVSEDE